MMVLEGINGTHDKVNFAESPRTSSTQLPGPLPTAARWSVFQLASGVQTSSVQGTLVSPGLLRQPPSRKARRSPPRLSLTYSVTDASSFRSPPFPSHGSPWGTPQHSLWDRGWEPEFLNAPQLSRSSSRVLFSIPLRSQIGQDSPWNHHLIRG